MEGKETRAVPGSEQLGFMGACQGGGTHGNLWRSRAVEPTGQSRGGKQGGTLLFSSRIWDVGEVLTGWSVGAAAFQFSLSH